MAFISAGDLRERVQVREFTYDRQTDAWSWETAWGSWAKVEQNERANLFSSVGVGARSVTFTMRKNTALTLRRSFLWRGQFCFLTAITDAEQSGMMEVKAALCATVDCQKDMDLTPSGYKFPGVLTEKYVGHQQLEPNAVVTTTFVLVTPKDVELDPGSLVGIGGRAHRVLCPHELDPWKNEYEVRRLEDC